jgi:hypothetical protein
MKIGGMHPVADRIELSDDTINMRVNIVLYIDLNVASTEKLLIVSGNPRLIALSSLQQLILG